MDDSKAAALQTIQTIMTNMAEPSSPISPSRSHFGMAKPKDFLVRLGGKASKDKDLLTPDIAEAKAIVSEKWDLQRQILEGYLVRNRRITAGETPPFDEKDILESDAKSGAEFTTPSRPLSKLFGTGLHVHDFSDTSILSDEFKDGLEDALSNVTISSSAATTPSP